jgi:hypothetical protein
VATLDPDLPFIDPVVLRNLGCRFPKGTVSERIEGITSLHECLAEGYAGFLDTDAGRHLIARFTGEFPKFPITKMKMLDLVLRQTRD